MALFEGIIAGAIGGIGWSIVGTAKELTKPKHDDFDAKKWIKTAIIGAAIGGYTGYTGQEFNIASMDLLVQSAMFTPIVAIADKIVGIIWNLFSRERKK